MNIRHLTSHAAAGLIPLLVAFIALPSPTTQQQIDPGAGPGFAAPSFCPNKIEVEPVVIYDVSGSTFAGPFHQHLTVYNSGLATFARATNFSEPEVAVAQVSPADIAQLESDLDALGARSLCDIPTLVSDVPLTTVTVFAGATDARAHTFSFFLSIKQQGAVKQLLESFIATHFQSA